MYQHFWIRFLPQVAQVQRSSQTPGSSISVSSAGNRWIQSKTTDPQWNVTQAGASYLFTGNLFFKPPSLFSLFLPPVTERHIKAANSARLNLTKLTNEQKGCTCPSRHGRLSYHQLPKLSERKRHGPCSKKQPSSSIKAVNYWFATIFASRASWVFFSSTAAWMSSFVTSASRDWVSRSVKSADGDVILSTAFTHAVTSSRDGNWQTNKAEQRCFKLRALSHFLL